MPLTESDKQDLTDLRDLALRVDTRLQSIRDWLIVVVVVAGFAITTLAGVAWSNRQNQIRSDNSREAARIGACIQARAQAKEQAQIEKDLERERRAPDPATAELTKALLARLGITQAQLDQINANKLAAYDAQVDSEHKIRDCTPQGIVAFYDGTGGYLTTPTTKGTP